MSHRRSPSDDPPRNGLREMSLMHVFRASAGRRDGRHSDSRATGEGETDLTLRSRKRREGITEDALRQNLARDIASLMNTIRLDVSADLAGAPRVARSVVNYGFQDMDTLWRDARTPTAMAAAIRAALIANEPRLRPGSIEVRIEDAVTATSQRIQFEISAEMISNPTDIPLQFFAEMDPGLGKLSLRRMQGEP